MAEIYPADHRCHGRRRSKNVAIVFCNSMTWPYGYYRKTAHDIGGQMATQVQSFLRDAAGGRFDLGRKSARLHHSMLEPGIPRLEIKAGIAVPFAIAKATGLVLAP